MIRDTHTKKHTVNNPALHSQYDFCFRFLLLHTLAQGDRIESVLFHLVLASYPTRHSWIISAHINLRTLHKPMHMFNSVVLLHCGCLSLNPFIEFRIRNNSSSSDVLYIQASISISPKYESKSKTTSHCHLLLHAV